MGASVPSVAPKWDRAFDALHVTCVREIVVRTPRVGGIIGCA